MHNLEEHSMYYHRILIISAPKWRIWTAYLRIPSPWLKKILDFDDLKCLRMKDLSCLSQINFTMVEENFELWWSLIPKNKGFELLISEYIHHGWRKFWILMISNAQWRTWTTDLRISLPWLMKILDFDDVKYPRMKDLSYWSQN